MQGIEERDSEYNDTRNVEYELGKINGRNMKRNFNGLEERAALTEISNGTYDS
jgi:hypothetical protein